MPNFAQIYSLFQPNVNKFVKDFLLHAATDPRIYRPVFDSISNLISQGRSKNRNGAWLDREIKGAGTKFKLVREKFGSTKNPKLMELTMDLADPEKAIIMKSALGSKSNSRYEDLFASGQNMASYEVGSEEDSTTFFLSTALVARAEASITPAPIVVIGEVTGVLTRALTLQTSQAIENGSFTGVDQPILTINEEISDEMSDLAPVYKGIGSMSSVEISSQGKVDKTIQRDERFNSLDSLVKNVLVERNLQTFIEKNCDQRGSDNGELYSQAEVVKMVLDGLEHQEGPKREEEKDPERQEMNESNQGFL